MNWLLVSEDVGRKEAEKGCYSYCAIMLTEAFELLLLYNYNYCVIREETDLLNTTTTIVPYLYKDTRTLFDISFAHRKNMCASV